MCACMCISVGVYILYVIYERVCVGVRDGVCFYAMCERVYVCVRGSL